MLQRFVDNDKETELQLPGLNSYQRWKLHRACDLRKLIHESAGQGDSRTLIISKPPPSGGMRRFVGAL